MMCRIEYLCWLRWFAIGCLGGYHFPAIAKSIPGDDVVSIMLKKERVKQLYEQKHYGKAHAIIETLLPLLTNKADLEEIQWIEAYCNYYNHCLEDSSTQFNLFIKHHPFSPKVAEASFMRGYGLAQIEVDIKLDQKITHDAIHYLESYLAAYPNGGYVDKAETALEHLQKHLMQKSLQAAALYIRLGHYHAAVITLKNIEQTYPDAQQTIGYLLLNSYKQWEKATKHPQIKIDTPVQKNLIILYTKPSCPYCQRAKALLESKKVTYQAIDVLQHPHVFNSIKRQYHVTTLPQIFINGTHIGGSDRLIELEDTGKLNVMLGIKDA